MSTEFGLIDLYRAAALAGICASQNKWNHTNPMEINYNTTSRMAIKQAEDMLGYAVSVDLLGLEEKR